MPTWTTPAAVIAALGDGAAPPPDDAWLVACVDAANAAAYRKRREAGYVDDAAPDAPAPSPDVGLGATYWARDLWRERASTDSYPSYDDLAAFTPTVGAWSQIRRLLGIGRAQVDAAPLGLVTVRARARARRWYVW